MAEEEDEGAVAIVRKKFFRVVDKLVVNTLARR